MIDLVKGKKHQVIKRDGRLEPYNEDKMRKVLDWAIRKAVIEHFGNENKDLINRMINEVLQDTKIKIYDKIYISKLFDEVISTCENKISRLQPVWDKVTRNLLVQKYYKEIWNIKRNEYPNYLEVVKKGAQYKVKPYIDILENFTEDEIKELGGFIKPEKDFYFTSLGLKNFMAKYALKYTKNKILELPQHTFLRLAIKPFIYEDKNIRMQLIKERYEHLSETIFSEATPRFNDNDMEASCVLIKMGDDSWSITRTVQSVALYSKHGGGTAVDVSDIRAIGSKIGANNESDGVIPFIKMIESAVSAFKQGNTRRGACAIYFNWWHYEAEDLIMLKDEGGNEEKRARKLQYGIKINRLFLNRIKNNEMITLFDPKDVPELINSYGKEFEKWYNYYENKNGIRKKKINARDLAYLIAKVRLETGNLYIFLDENVNENKPFDNYISQSNLCSEIVLPTKASYLKEENVIVKDFKDMEIESKIDNGLIALCNLSSINIVQWFKLNEEQKDRVAYLLLRSHDNLIDNAFYPVKEGEIHNKLYRPIGIGITNFAYYIAKNQVYIDSEKGLKLQFDIMEDIYYYLYKNAIRLAKERGRFAYFDKTKWKDGWLPINMNYELFLEYANIEQENRWKELREQIKQYGIRFSTVGAIAPTSTSALIMKGGSTESVNLPKSLVAQKSSGIKGYQLAPEFWKYGQYYRCQYEVSNEWLLKLAQIRQLFLDQAQSIDLFYEEYSAFEVIKDIIQADKLGIKTLYYANSKKIDEKEVCESCSS